MPSGFVSSWNEDSIALGANEIKNGRADTPPRQVASRAGTHHQLITLSGCYSDYDFQDAPEIQPGEKLLLDAKTAVPRRLDLLDVHCHRHCVSNSEAQGEVACLARFAAPESRA